MPWKREEVGTGGRRERGLQFSLGWAGEAGLGKRHFSQLLEKKHSRTRGELVQRP